MLISTSYVLYGFNAHFHEHVEARGSCSPGYVYLHYFHCGNATRVFALLFKLFYEIYANSTFADFPYLNIA